METLIIYDGIGQLYLQRTGIDITPEGGIQFIVTEIPTGKIITGVDTTVTPNIPIYEDAPLSETELLKKRIEEQEAALVELASLVGGAV